MIGSDLAFRTGLDFREGATPHKTIGAAMPNVRNSWVFVKRAVHEIRTSALCVPAKEPTVIRLAVFATRGTERARHDCKMLVLAKYASKG